MGGDVVLVAHRRRDAAGDERVGVGRLPGALLGQGPDHRGAQHPGRGPGDVDDDDVAALGDRGLAGAGRGDRHRAGAGVPRGQGLDPGEDRQGALAVRCDEGDGGHVDLGLDDVLPRAVGLGGLGDDGHDEPARLDRTHQGEVVAGGRQGGQQGGVGRAGVGLEPARGQLAPRPGHLGRVGGPACVVVVVGAHGRPAASSASGRLNAPL